MHVPIHKMAGEADRNGSKEEESPWRSTRREVRRKLSKTLNGDSVAQRHGDEKKEEQHDDTQEEEAIGHTLYTPPARDQPIFHLNWFGFREKKKLMIPIITITPPSRSVSPSTSSSSSPKSIPQHPSNRLYPHTTYVCNCAKKPSVNGKRTVSAYRPSGSPGQDGDIIMTNEGEDGDVSNTRNENDISPAVQHLLQQSEAELAIERQNAIRGPTKEEIRDRSNRGAKWVGNVTEQRGRFSVVIGHVVKEGRVWAEKAKKGIAEWRRLGRRREGKLERYDKGRKDSALGGESIRRR